MCGLSGIINSGKQPVSYKEIQGLTRLVSHRGPDDEGYFFGDNFAFGHCRLAIIDLSKAGHQPMHYDDRYVTIHNGEIYNYLELRDELTRCGYDFKSETDTEIILVAYDHWGAECVQHFNGMWSFAIYDKLRQIIFCSRDRFGIKPFYYTQLDNQFVFGSEIKQLLSFYKSIYVNTSILIDYLVTGIQEHNFETFFENIFKLRPSHNLIYDLKTNTFEQNRYYRIRIHKEIQDQHENESINLYKQKLEHAVMIRLRSDVKVGTCLSGGMDSSAIAAIASSQYREKSNTKFNAITAKSTDKTLDESHFAKLVVDAANLQWNLVEPTYEDFKRDVGDVVYTQEEPFGSPSIFMQYYVLKKAREIGCTVMLDGQGGDETLLGYWKYFPAAYIQSFRDNGLLKTLSEIKKSNKNNTRMSFRGILFYIVGTLFSTVRKKEHIRRCFFLKKKYLNQFRFLKDLAECYFDIHRLQVYEIEKTNLPILLRYEDRNSMRHSIETRLPFIDYEALETALSIDLNYKIKDGWTKLVLRKGMQERLPAEVIWRKDKLGFNAPEESWLSRHYDEMLAALDGSKILQKISDLQILKNSFHSLSRTLQWRLYNIAKWEKIFKVGIH